MYHFIAFQKANICKLIQFDLFGFFKAENLENRMLFPKCTLSAAVGFLNILAGLTSLF